MEGVARSREGACRPGCPWVLTPTEVRWEKPSMRHKVVPKARITQTPAAPNSSACPDSLCFLFHLRPLLHIFRSQGSLAN